MLATPELRQSAYNAFISQNIEKKMALAGALTASEAINTIAKIQLKNNQYQPGLPKKPELRDPLNVDKRSPFTPAGHAALMHAICHIEFNAVKTVYNECIIILMAYFDQSLQLHQVFERQTGAWRFSPSARKASRRLCS